MVVHGTLYIEIYDTNYVLNNPVLMINWLCLPLDWCVDDSNPVDKIIVGRVWGSVDSWGGRGLIQVYCGNPRTYLSLWEGVSSAVIYFTYFKCQFPHKKIHYIYYKWIDTSSTVLFLIYSWSINCNIQINANRFATWILFERKYKHILCWIVILQLNLIDPVLSNLIRRHL